MQLSLDALGFCNVHVVWQAMNGQHEMCVFSVTVNFYRLKKIIKYTRELSSICMLFALNSEKIQKIFVKNSMCIESQIRVNINKLLVKLGKAIVKVLLLELADNNGTEENTKA